MSFVRQFDSDINPRILDVSKYNLGRYGRRRLLYLKEHHPDVYTTMIFEGTLGKHLEEINDECCNRIYDVTESWRVRKVWTKPSKRAISFCG